MLKLEAMVRVDERDRKIESLFNQQVSIKSRKENIKSCEECIEQINKYIDNHTSDLTKWKVILNDLIELNQQSDSMRVYITQRDLDTNTGRQDFLNKLGEI